MVLALRGAMVASTRFGSSLAADPSQAVREVRDAVGQPDLDAVVFFCSASYDLRRLGRELRDAFACPVIGCTTAGQIGPGGYQQGGLTAVSVAGGVLRARPFLVAPLSQGSARAAEVAAEVRVAVDALPPARQRVCLLLADGLSRAEESLAATLYRGMGDVALVGGSAGDDLRFERTHVYWEGEFRTDAAVVTLLDTPLQIGVLKVQHFRPTARKLVITAADPTARRVKEIDGFPAAETYAEKLGVPVEALDATLMSAHPLMLRIGDDHFIRSVQRVNPDRSLSLYCAIEEGLVLSIGEAIDPLTTLSDGFDQGLAGIRDPALVIGCDCILRRLELEQRGKAGEVGSFLARHRVIGFSTYGEQVNGVHVNQTFTGIALGG